MFTIYATVQGGVIQDLTLRDEFGEFVDSETILVDMDGCNEDDGDDNREPWTRESRDDADGNWMGY